MLKLEGGKVMLGMHVKKNEINYLLNIKIYYTNSNWEKFFFNNMDIRVIYNLIFISLWNF